MGQKKLDTAAARVMYDDGQNDCEIGRALDVSANSVRAWRLKNGLEANARPGVQACAEKAPAMATSSAVTPEEHEKLAALIRDKLGGTKSASGYTSSVTNGDTFPSRGRQDGERRRAKSSRPTEAVEGEDGELRRAGPEAAILAPQRELMSRSSRPTGTAEDEDGKRAEMPKEPRKPYCMTVGALSELLLEVLKEIPAETEIHNSCGDNITGLSVSKIYNPDGSFDEVDVCLTTEGD